VLPSDTYRKPITSITGVLLPFVTYLLTLPGTSNFEGFQSKGFNFDEFICGGGVAA
jgi:hypothetical protein